MTDNMNPVSLKRMIQGLDLLAETPRATPKQLAALLDTNARYARGILQEFNRCGFVKHLQTLYLITGLGRKFLTAGQHNDLDQIHLMLAEHHPFYRELLAMFETQLHPHPGYTQPEVVDLLAAHQLNFNLMAVSVLLQWGQWLGVIHRNLFSLDDTGATHYYTHKCTPLSSKSVLTSLGSFYQAFLKDDASQDPPNYASIPRLREYTCEHLRITRTQFDNQLRHFLHKYPDQIDLWSTLDTLDPKLTSAAAQTLQYDPDERVSTKSYILDREIPFEFHGKYYDRLKIHSDILRGIHE